MEEIKKIEVQGQQYGVADMLMRGVMGGNAQVIAWSHTHNMNDYKDAGTYRIKGERTGSPLEDNLPIMNQGSGHTIEGVLYVLDSSLANGSGKEDDCTITQFLMLSNRVGGQEGDMYMRSAYGVNKDLLNWKPWEKYQTNMEVGCVSDYEILNPSNPTEIIEYIGGMKDLKDNGIYSGVYIPPKALLGTYADAGIKDPTAIETFVMVVINNYAAASNARCITQIKFAVTNGGVFSMEKRSTPPGSLHFSQWEAVGGGTGGSSNSLINEPNTSNSSSLVIDSGAVNLKFSTYGGDWDITAKKDSLEFKNNNHNLKCYISNDGLAIGSDAGGSGGIAIDNNVKIGENVNIKKSQISTTEHRYTINLWSQQELVESNVNMSGTKINTSYTEHLSNYDNATGVTLKSDGSVAYIGASEHKDFRDDTYSVKMNQMYITDTSFRVLHIEKTQDSDVEIETTIAHGIAITPSEDGSKLLLSYNGKTAELQLT